MIDARKLADRLMHRHVNTVKIGPDYIDVCLSISERDLIIAALRAEPVQDDEDTRDAMLFRLWIRMCGHSAVRVANGLANCIQPEEYREALAKLAQEEGVNLPSRRTPTKPSPQTSGAQ